ncbi:MAG TPA: TolC family protein [Gemmatimonadaceae bacterium]|jgi:outer membrane protein|nr:TolC family protein [Gemmatimonadaceae bacterium]
MIRLCIVLGALTLAGQAGAQSPDSAGPVLTLSDAQQIAKHNNPVYLQSVVARRSASANLRAAYGQFLPQAGANFFAQYSQSGTQFSSGAALGASSNYEQSQWQLNLQYTLSANVLISPAYNRANRDAAEADIGSAAATLRNNVASAYIAVVTAVAQANLQDTLVSDDSAQLLLAQARVAAGAATPLDVQRAEVTLGQQKVSAVQAHNQVDVTKLQLFQTLGVTQPKGVQVRDTFQVAPVEYTLDSLQAIARQSNPQLVALLARERAAGVDLTRQRGLYTPTLQINTGLSGYTFSYTNSNAAVVSAAQNQQIGYELCIAAGGTVATCGSPNLTPGEIQTLKNQNNGFPFGFINNPRQITATLSLPIFDGFVREQKIEQAAANRSDAQYNRRAQELALTANVTSAYLSLTTAQKTAALQQENAAKAREELALAEARYQVGAASSLDVTDAVASFERAETDRINAVYSYQTAFAALESAVGRPLR